MTCFPAACQGAGSGVGVTRPHKSQSQGPVLGQGSQLCASSGTPLPFWKTSPTSVSYTYRPRRCLASV